MGAYCTLLEYNNIEGMILLSELSRRRIRSINKLIRVGRNEAVLVLRVDKEKGYIDLSKRRVSPEDVTVAEDKFNKSRLVQGIIRHTAEVCKMTTQELCEKVSWPLYKKYSHAFDAFKLAVAEPDTVFAGLDITPKVRDELLENIRHRLMPQPIKLRADVEVSCFTYEGIDAIKNALRKAQISDGDEAVKITLVAPPAYVFVCTSLDKAKGIDLLKRSIEIVKSEIESSGGKCEVKAEPRSVSQKDDDALAQVMDALQKANTDVGGDDDANDMEAEGEGEDE
eukprot:c896_g1_i1.p1 GENE.c896_g1_i1~~c896_g1_i1.p1  ORF type:complete len:328 (+),score=86.39 c896_g1_i1:140-985(+)